MVTHRAEWLDPVFIALSWLGSNAFVWIALALVGAAVWRRPTLFLYVASAALVADIITSILKIVIGRDRPPLAYSEPEALVEVPATNSFPSGHSSTSFACATLLARAAPRLTIPLYGLAALIAFSRVYVGVHYPLDTIAGAVLGVGVAYGILWLVKFLRRSRETTPT